LIINLQWYGKFISNHIKELIEGLGIKQNGFQENKTRNFLMSVDIVAMAVVGGGYSIEAAGACTISYNGLAPVLP
jgi:hypothetical protein